MFKKLNYCLTIVFILFFIFSIKVVAEVQSVKVSGDIIVYGLWSEDYDLKASSGPGDAAWYQSVARVKIDADLTDNVTATVRLLNERDWNTETTTDTDVDLDLAYMKLKEILYMPVTLTIGRQELNDLTDLIVGDPDTNDTSACTDISGTDLSARKSFDTIRADFNYFPWTITLLTSKINDSDVNPSVNNEDLYGLNVAYDFINKNRNAAGYVFLKNSNDQDEQEIYVIGTKGAYDPVENLTLAGELAMQTGDYSASRDQDAWALDLSGKYIFSDNQYTPSLELAYIFRSGEESGDSGDHEAWDTMYENQVHGGVANYLFGGVNEGTESNCHIIKLRGEFKPIKSITASLDYYHFILDEAFSAGSKTFDTGKTYTMTTDDDLGDEVNVGLSYNYTQDVQFNLIYAVFMPGDAFADSNNDNASKVLSSVRVSF